MCDVCGEQHVNMYLANQWAQQYETQAEYTPGLMETQIPTQEVDEVLSAVHYGNEGHGFFAGAGVEKYQDLVNKLKELSEHPADH